MQVQEGSYGKAEWIEMPDTPESAETLCSWLITSPYWHPAWSQFNLFVVRLRDDIPGFPPPHRQFEGATHELLVFAMNPGEVGAPPHTPASMLEHYTSKRTNSLFLTPVNIVQQHEATDEEMLRLAELSCWAVVNGFINPETSDAPSIIRENWLASATKSLAHMRGEEHAP